MGGQTLKEIDFLNHPVLKVFLKSFEADQNRRAISQAYLLGGLSKSM